jgi:hypothetical protein
MHTPGPIKHFHGGTRSHTAGPWTVAPEDWLTSQSSGMGYRNFPVRAPEGFDVAMVYCDEDDQEQDANVQLIAAAPELLWAANVALSMLGGDDSGPDDEDMHDIWVRLRAAVSKATGKEVPNG